MQPPALQADNIGFAGQIVVPQSAVWTMGRGDTFRRGDTCRSAHTRFYWLIIPQSYWCRQFRSEHAHSFECDFMNDLAVLNKYEMLTLIVGYILSVYPGNFS